MKNKLLLIGLLFIGLGAFAQVSEKELAQDFQKEVVSPQDLAKWDFYGLGKAYTEVHNQFCITEADVSKGAMIVSPKRYGENIIVRYKAMTLTHAAVLVAMLSASDHGKSTGLTVPENHDGAMPFWRDEVDCYFFAFRNGPHNFTPFVRKYPKKDNTALGSAEENVMYAGKFHDIEVGRIGKKLWLKIDGSLMFDAVDEKPLTEGRIAFRTRGTAGFKAAFLMKDLEIYTKND
ncbi:hypothetical protein EYV94_00170 [Puteibacter caeruleilacunae]|nr:hypothetical protein EYV94_00170 [Puteibacter caeruleilacunae]